MQAKLTIDLNAICDNWRALDALSAQSVETGAVIKADAYGLGANIVGPALAAAGVKTFFVAQAEEGVVLRRAIGAGPRIFNFSGLMAGDQQALDEYNVIPVLNSVAQINAFKTGRCAVQFDSGMNRLGLEPAEVAKLTGKIAALGPELVISHLACADEPDHSMNTAQLAGFRAMSVDFPKTAKSLAATGGVLLGSDYHYDLTRPGIGLYGGLPFVGAKPVVVLDLPVIQVRDVLVGETVGYGNNWTAGKTTKIATVSGGYADGILRSSGSANLYADGVACPIVGRVSMDLITVDVSALKTVPPMLSLLNNVQTVDVLADHAGTIGYEILTGLGARYKCRYIGGS
ncbi:MAG: alanine racemase [Rhodobacteraceae bacterium]|nr:alanine racemase [Paracoccaceae bacterium]